MVKTSQTATVKAIITKVNCVGRHRSVRYGSKWHQRVTQDFNECKLLIEYEVDGRMYKATLSTADQLFVEGELIIVRYDINNPGHVWLDTNNTGIISWILIVIIFCVLCSMSIIVKFTAV